MKRIIKTLSISTVALLSFGMVVDAGVKETDNYSEDTYIIGYTRFSASSPITAQSSATAGQRFERLNNQLGKPQKDVKTYLKSELDGEWYDLSDGEPLDNSEKNELTNNLEIYYVDGEEKTIELEYAGTVDPNSLPEGVTYENGKLKVPATKTKFSFKDANGATVEASTNNNEKELAVKKNPTISFSLAEKVVVGEPIEFTVSTTANDYKDTPVVGVGGLSDESAIEKLEYYETNGNQWLTLPSTGFGSASGFALSDATSKFRVTFKKAGTFDVKFGVKRVEDDAILANATTNIEVVDTKEVNNLGELQTALNNQYVKTIKLNDNIETNNSIVISREVTIDGNDKTISFGTMPTAWQSNGDNYVVKVYNTTATIKNIKLTNSLVGLLVQSSNVTLVGDIDVSGNKLGGIESSKSSNAGLPNPNLKTKSATITNSNEGSNNVTMWEDKVTGTIETNLKSIDAKAFGKTNQTFYFNSIPTTAEVNSVEGFKYALEKGFVSIKLIGDIVLDDTITLNKNLTIDLNGKNITTNGNINEMFVVEKGNFEIKGSGKLTTTKGDGIKILGSVTDEGENYTVVTIGKDVTIEAKDYAAYIAKNQATDGKYHAYGVVVNINGTLKGGNTYGGFFINGYIQDKEGNFPRVNIIGTADAKVNISSDENQKSAGIYAAGYAHWNIKYANITGTGFGLGLKAGKFTIKNSNISATGDKETPSKNNNGSNSSGAALHVETNAVYADSIELDVSNSTFTSENGYAFLEFLGESEIKEIRFTNTEFITHAPIDINPIETTSKFKEKYEIMHSEGTNLYAITPKQNS